MKVKIVKAKRKEESEDWLKYFVTRDLGNYLYENFDKCFKLVKTGEFETELETLPTYTYEINIEEVKEED